ncbi:MAG: metallophosphatase domain-containing protein [Myxococcales bacterium]|nr:metallophosphatase domain-containing protein [Myxococcales bacterium]
MVRLVAISDTHGAHDRVSVPDGDILVHAGDLTGLGELAELHRANDFLAAQPHAHKVVIAGNHDWCFVRQPDQARAALSAARYLQDEAAEVCGLRFYGSPWQPWFLNWAFNLPRGPQLAARWAAIPDDTDVLITHGPPRGILDRTFAEAHAGCDALLARVTQIRPLTHIFGHIHEAAGVRVRGGTTFVNASACDSGRAVVLDIEGGVVHVRAVEALD